ncbi:MAG: hypothetical protein LBF77_03690, partial [Spirochaetaceae bacterium]|nr:hypothetical protein [Spirochaetaceae bacterium]
TISFMCNKCTHGDPPTQFSCPFMDIADANSIVHTIIPGNYTGKKPFELDIKIICYSGVKE